MEARDRMNPDPNGGDAALDTISAIEARILGCLVEKQATTPEQYPLTANAVQVACNQKNNRDPLMELEAGEVGHALRELETRGLVRSVHGARAQRYEHRVATTWSLTTKQQALLAVMFLRGPQTLAELLTRSERLVPIGDLDDVRQTLDRLMQRAPALVVKLGRALGQREDRYMHLLCGPVSAADWAVSPGPASDEAAPTARRGALEARVDALEAEVARLRDALDALRGS
jgi:uncharacterized protein YceH (UPF0502 family)